MLFRSIAVPVMIFPGAWLAGVLVICLTHANVAIGTVIAMVWGFACYLVALNVLQRRFRSPSGILSFAYGIGILIVFAGIVLGSANLVRAYDWLTWNPIGEATDNGWGWVPCEKNDVRTVPNGSGLVATIRRTDCPGFMEGDEGLSYFVFIHSTLQPISANNLVLRYEATDAGWDASPFVTWIDAHSVRVAVGRGDIVQVTKQEPVGGGVSIEYALGTAVLPPALQYWSRPLW